MSGRHATSSIHPLAIVSLSSSLLAYASSFAGSFALVWLGLAVSVIAIVSRHLARRAIRVGSDRFGGKAIATAGLVAGYAYLALGSALIALTRGVAPA